MNLKKDGVSISVLMTKELYEAVKNDAENKTVSIGSLIRMILAEKYLGD